MAKNLKVGDLVKVKKDLKDTEYAEATPCILSLSGMTFRVNKVDIKGAGTNTYELTALTSNGYLVMGEYEIEDFVFDGKWLKLVNEVLGVGAIAPKTDVKQFAMIKSATGLTLILDGKTLSVSSTHANYNKIVECINNKEYNKIEDLVNLSKAIDSFGKGKLEVNKGIVKYNGQQLHGCIVDSILGLLKDGFSVEPIVNFLDNLQNNPSNRAINELYGFLEYGKLPITDDGCFLTYKKVRNDFKDIHSGTFDNSVGKTCEMPRNKVDDNPNNTCSNGLHVCSYEYTKSFGDSTSRLVLCKVNPADVVSIPVDYNNTKMRCCKYVVVAEVNDKSDVLKGKSLYNA